MKGWRFARARLTRWSRVALVAMIASVPSPALAAPLSLQAQAEAAEQAGRWDKALDAYLKLANANGPTPELRERVRHSIKHAAQFRRHRDPAFQQFVRDLPPADAVALYRDVVEKLGRLHADRERAAPGSLVGYGLDELDAALGDERFRRSLAPADPNAVTEFRQALRGAWRSQLPTTPDEAARQAGELARVAQAQLGLSPSAAILELIGGACTGLDEATQFRESPAESPGSLGELHLYGLHLAWRGDALLVEGVQPGSFAALHTTLRRGDRITRLNGQPLDGDPGVALSALRAGGGFGHDLELLVPETGATASVRLPLPAPSVFGAEIVQFRDGVGYVRLAAFREGTPRELDEAVDSLRSRGLRSLVLDIRGNPGGLFTAAVLVAQKFVPSGVIVSTHGQVAEFAGRTFDATGTMPTWDFPVVLLIDGKTMSAAELVAAALKEQGRATLIGLPTFGKGGVQCPVRVPGGTLVVTVAAMHGPAGRPLRLGVEPHQHEPDPLRQLEQAVSRAAELAAGR